METENNMKRAYRISVIVGMAIIGSLLVCVILVELIASQRVSLLDTMTAANMQMLRYVFYALSVVNVIVLRIIRGTMLRKSSADDRQALIGKLQKTSLITTALCEGPAIFGLVLFLLGGGRRDFYFLLIVSFILLFMYFPRLKNWEAWLEGHSPCPCLDERKPPC